MTTKKTTKNEAPEETTAAEELEQELSDEELLADLPELRAPERLRLRHRNRIMAAYFKAERNGLVLDGDDEAPDDNASAPENLEVMLEMLADIDDFAEAIAFDKDAYVEWAEKNSANYPAYMAIMRRYVSAVGESNGSSS